MPARRSRAAVKECLDIYNTALHDISIFTQGVRDFFEAHPTLRKGSPPVIHSVKWRLKDATRLQEKLERKGYGSPRANGAQLFARLTDLGGVRVLHLYQEQFRDIHAVIMGRCESKDWTLREKPIAYTWDPESVDFFNSLGIRTLNKPTMYTSIHYLVKPRPQSRICCEIQVRTLFEEIWGEIDHAINYPTPSKNRACTEQLRVLTKLAGAGTRLADAIFRTHARPSTRAS